MSSEYLASDTTGEERAPDRVDRTPRPRFVPAVREGDPAPRLWRSRSDRVLAGVIGGLAEKYGWEARPMRILVGLLGALALPAGMLPVLIPYAVLWAVTSAYGTPPAPRPFRRSRSEAVVAGVLGGLAAKWRMSPTTVRIGYAALTAATFVLPGIVTYLVMWARTPTAGPITGEQLRR